MYIDIKAIYFLYNTDTRRPGKFECVSIMIIQDAFNEMQNQ